MKKVLIKLISISLFVSVYCFAQYNSGLPIKYVNGCEDDFNYDGKMDSAIILETSAGCQLLVLLKTETGYTTYILSVNCKNMYLSSNYGGELKGIMAGDINKNAKTYKIKGAYLKLTQPEGAEAAFFWDKAMFQEIWLKD